jgi:hypothetical protein
VTMRVGTNLWHLDLGPRFPDAVGRREACDGRPTGFVSAWRMKVLGVVGQVSALARDCPKENGTWASPLGEWRQADSKEAG